MTKRYINKMVSVLLVFAVMLTLLSVLPQAVQVSALSERDTMVRDYVAGGERAELFNDNWKFFFERTSSATAALTVNANPPGFDDSGWDDVELPHDFQIHRLGAVSTENNSSAMYANGAGWYRKTFYMMPESQGQIVTLRFDGAYQDVNVWINGTLMTTNPLDTTRTWAYGYSVFYLDITQYLNYGNTPNVIAVRCRSQVANSRWYSGGGLYRNVWMIQTDPVHVVNDGTYISTNGAGGQITMDTEVINKSSERYPMCCSCRKCSTLMA